MPKRVEHALTEINAFRLNTMARAEQREHFECLQREREMKATEARQLVCFVYILKIYTNTYSAYCILTIPMPYPTF